MGGTEMWPRRRLAGGTKTGRGDWGGAERCLAPKGRRGEKLERRCDSHAASQRSRAIKGQRARELGGRGVRGGATLIAHQRRRALSLAPLLGVQPNNFCRLLFAAHVTKRRWLLWLRKEWQQLGRRRLK
jgi:hypothetical protein